MTVATTSDTGYEPYERPDLTKVKPVHAQLMRAYVGALASASQFGRQQGPSENNSFASGMVIRWLVGSHIKRNLIVLGNVYLQIEQTFTCYDSYPMDSWLLKVREGCLAAAETLPRLRLPGILGIISAVVAAAGLLSKLPGSVGIFFLIIALIVVANVWIFYATIRSSYLYKRSLFLSDASRVDRETAEEQKAVQGNNIYALEDELYGLLHRGKRRETEIDWLLVWLSTFLVSYGAAIIALSVDHGRPGVFVYAPVIIGFTIILILKRRKRTRIWL